MTKQNDKAGTPNKTAKTSNSDSFRKGGYQPTNKGYTADASRGYSATNGQSIPKLPKAPKGGTGVTPPATNQTVNEKKV